MIFVATCGVSVDETVLEFSHLWEPTHLPAEEKRVTEIFPAPARSFSPSSGLAAEPSLSQPLSSGVCWLGRKAGGR